MIETLEQKMTNAKEDLKMNYLSYEDKYEKSTGETMLETIDRYAGDGVKFGVIAGLIVGGFVSDYAIDSIEQANSIDVPSFLHYGLVSLSAGIGALGLGKYLGRVGVDRGVEHANSIVKENLQIEF